MKGYRPYSTFVEEGFQPQQSFMFAHLQVIHSYVNMIHITIMFLCDLGRATSHIQNLLKRASCLNTHSCVFPNMISVALWHSSKAADSVRHDKVLDTMVIT